MKYLVIPADKVSLNNRLYTIETLLEIKKHLDIRKYKTVFYEYEIKNNFDADIRKYVGRYYDVHVNEEGLYLDFQLELITDYSKILLESRELFKPTIGILSTTDNINNINYVNSKLGVFGVFIQLVKNSEWYPYLKNYYNIKE